MKKLSSSQIRLIRKWRNFKSNCFYWVFSLFVTGVFFIGLCASAKWVIREGAYLWHMYVVDDYYDSYNYSFDINDSYIFCDNGPHGYIKDSRTDRKVLQDIKWVSSLLYEDDSLLCFASNGYRGYFNVNTGKVDIPADTYVKAWNFSEGVAAAMRPDSTIVFIHPDGTLGIDEGHRYASLPDGQGFVFHNGFCQITYAEGTWGFIDRIGRLVVDTQYDKILYDDHDCWIVSQDGLYGVLNDTLQFILPLEYTDLHITDAGIDALTADHVRQQFDFSGNLVRPFMYTSVEELYYKTGVNNFNEDDFEWAVSPYKLYRTTYEDTNPAHVGLLAPDGTPVTPPAYTAIEAINDHLFRCYCDNTSYHCDGDGLSIIINAQGHPLPPNP